ncbi:type IV toxin-antitoxin system AbiEi family antitoxin domain-containing protein [Microbacterium sp.]|uniref:type IV toxin-antitoxin system AbiEi family antitoxin domain-containing protein n=1 Tax=Microbacterium sp. TaxID=51671 RepID=UPI0028124A86|nr:type IV toxin-antitoxin system AbiEi family antitoxin domain-containing protein [Microbacterium sp.]
MPHTDLIVTAVARLGGVTRTARLIELGFSRRDLHAAVQAGSLIRPRRGWVACRDADPLLVRVAKLGVILTCRTQAKRLGLWVHDDSGVAHVAVDPKATGGRRIGARIHWSQPLVPRHPDALEDPIENVLANIAECEPFEQALATWDSAFHAGLVEISAMARLPLRPAA